MNNNVYIGMLLISLTVVAWATKRAVMTSRILERIVMWVIIAIAMVTAATVMEVTSSPLTPEWDELLYKIMLGAFGVVCVLIPLVMIFVDPRSSTKTKA